MSKNEGKIAVVTGATGGIGFQVAKRLGEDGCTVILNGIEDDKGQERVAELNAAGITAEYYGFDVTDENAVNENINKIGHKHGKIDILVNNAGGLGGRSRFEEMTTEFFRSCHGIKPRFNLFCFKSRNSFSKKRRKTQRL
jgi:NAD(P)-dependent dehydrogenase (short-subunit alcohol dehydrogenase family)